MIITLIILGVLLAAAVVCMWLMWDRLQTKQQLDLEAKAALEANLELLQDSVNRTKIALENMNTDFDIQRSEHYKQLTNWKVQAATAETEARLEAKAETEKLKQILTNEYNLYASEVSEQRESLTHQLENYREKVNGILEPLQTLAKEEAARRFYCLELPEKDCADIQYLVENVAPHLTNQAIIPKLCWSEYVSKAFTDLALKTNIKDEPGIYKITNLTNNKSYVGKATNLKKRLSDHLKGACGMTTVADQAIHHAIVEQGFNNWTFEVVCYCDKEELNEREQFYIREFHSQEWGYNKNAGGGG